MKTFATLLLVGFVAVAPTSEKQSDKKLFVVNENFFAKQRVVYKSNHDIVSIFIPLNYINFKEDAEFKDSINVTSFFVEADITSDGKRINRGLYVFSKNKAKKILDNGTDMGATVGDSKIVFLGASDGLYVYEEDTEAVKKYGSINDDIICIAKEKTGDVIYILTANKEVYKVTENGNVKEKIENIVNAQQIVLDYANNIYFYADNKQPYVRTSEGVKKVSGLPENPSNIILIKPSYLIQDRIPCVVDNVLYDIFSNGTSEAYGIVFEPKYIPTAMSLEALMLQYQAHDKKIYEVTW